MPGSSPQREAMLVPGSVMGSVRPGGLGLLSRAPARFPGSGVGLTEQPPPAGSRAERFNRRDTEWRSHMGFYAARFKCPKNSSFLRVLIRLEDWGCVAYLKFIRSLTKRVCIVSPPCLPSGKRAKKGWRARGLEGLRTGPMG